jgi:hypothetical protein
MLLPSLKDSSSLKMEAADSFETITIIYHTRQCHIPEDSNLYSHLHHSLKHHTETTQFDTGIPSLKCISASKSMPNMFTRFVCTTFPLPSNDHFCVPVNSTSAQILPWKYYYITVTKQRSHSTNIYWEVWCSGNSLDLYSDTSIRTWLLLSNHQSSNHLTLCSLHSDSVTN